MQNIALALVAMLFAMIPTVLGMFPLWLAVSLHEGSTLLVVLNSLRLLVGPQVRQCSLITAATASSLCITAVPACPFSELMQDQDVQQRGGAHTVSKGAMYL